MWIWIGGVGGLVVVAGRGGEGSGGGGSMVEKNWVGEGVVWCMWEFKETGGGRLGLVG